eukprot:m.262489 g.262489  ORF g.262489 m.262489 type:complete len:315 (+) comp45810_c0_seq1:34-978(+)
MALLNMNCIVNVMMFAAVILMATNVSGFAGNSSRMVSFWYDPAAYGGSDINATLDLVRSHPGAVSRVMIYCGHGVGAGGSIVNDPKNNALCLDAGLIAGLKSAGVVPELVLNSGTSNVADFRALFANASAQIAFLVSEAKRFGVGGWNLDLEPVSSAASDAPIYSAFCGQLKTALHQIDVRLTIAVANWSPMLSNFAVLAGNVDRLLDMETYNANSMAGWLAGDNWGGYYNALLAPGVNRSKSGPGLGCWPQLCGKDLCWTTTAASGKPRMDRIKQDGVLEVALFRIIQIPSQKWPEDWWWPLLLDFVNTPLSN